MIANVLSIAGTDPTGGAGIQVDIKTFSAMGRGTLGADSAIVAPPAQAVLPNLYLLSPNNLTLNFLR